MQHKKIIVRIGNQYEVRTATSIIDLYYLICANMSKNSKLISEYFFNNGTNEYARIYVVYNTRVVELIDVSKCDII
jgi:hypothetical protein